MAQLRILGSDKVKTDFHSSATRSGALINHASSQERHSFIKQEGLLLQKFPPSYSASAVLGISAEAALYPITLHFHSDAISAAVVQVMPSWEQLIPNLQPKYEPPLNLVVSLIIGTDLEETVLDNVDDRTDLQCLPAPLAAHHPMSV
jgi:hypothetical protein